MIHLVQLSSPIGPLMAGAVDEGICLLEFGEGRRFEAESAALARLLKTEIIEGDHPHLSNLKTQLEEYFSGQRKSFDLPLVTPGTAFQQTVWQKLLQIPYGKTTSYLELSKSLGDPKSIRAVAHANGTNRIAIIIPCHRVIGSNGSLIGYGGGIWRKRWLLEFEQGHSGAARQGKLW